MSGVAPNPLDARGAAAYDAVWGRAVAGVPAFCRELVVLLAEAAG